VGFVGEPVRNSGEGGESVARASPPQLAGSPTGWL
jgi:hypothetical protein